MVISADKKLNSPSLTVWDFGGQKIFHSVHSLFLTKNGVYLAVFNVVKLNENPEQELDTLRFWLDSLALHAPKAPIFLVGTRAEEVHQDTFKAIDANLRA